MIAFLLGFVCGFALATAVFVWMNIRNPAALDAAEELGRKK